MADTRKDKIAAFNAAKTNLANLETTNALPAPLDKLGSAEPIGKVVDRTSTNKEQIAQHNRPETEGERLAREDAEAKIALEQQTNARKQLETSAQAVVDSVNSTVDPWKEWLAAQPTPGGILAVLAFIIFFALAVIPVNDAGQTRLYLMWQTLVGRTHMLYSENSTTPNVQYGGAASGDFAASGAASAETNAGSTNNTLGSIDLTHLNLFGLG